jgi:integrase/recombinase XerD
VVARLSRDEERCLIRHTYRMAGIRGLLMKTLFQTGPRVSEFANMKAEEFSFDEQMILLAKARAARAAMCPCSRSRPKS